MYVYTFTFDTENRHDEVLAFTAWKQTQQIYSGGDIILWGGISVNEGRRLYYFREKHISRHDVVEFYI